MRLSKTFKAESFFERKGLLNHMLAIKRTKYWSMHSKPQAAGLVEKANMFAVLALIRRFYTMNLEKEDVNFF